MGLPSPAQASNDGGAFIDVLQRLYPDEWENFVERLGLHDLPKAKYTEDAALGLQVRLWASLRGQTLARTVVGMQHFEAALKLQAELEAGRDGANDTRPSCEASQGSAPGAGASVGEQQAARMSPKQAQRLAQRKVRYICACQVYGDYVRSGDTRAADIELLLHLYPSLRVAYIERATEPSASCHHPAKRPRSGRSTPREGTGEAEGSADKECWYSVLVRSDGDGGVLEECRIRLPGNPILGEGKPENQNAALPFTRGDKIMMIDMNQEGYFEEALKLRNLLEEFDDRRTRMRKPGPVTIVGFGEHVFTQSSGFVTAIYMALQEKYFCSFVQRVLDEPLDMRLHYGHPDLLDKVHFLTRGGVSKASKEINLSEDVFAGYKTALAGGSVVFREYMQVGKGRMTNLMEINGFFSKLSAGTATSCASRDVQRLTSSLPTWRLWTYYYSAIAWYLHDVLTMRVTILVPYLLAVLMSVGLDHRFTLGAGGLLSLTTLLPLFIAVVTCLPAYAMVLWDHGAKKSLAFVFGMVTTVSPVYFIFLAQTKAYSFASTVGGSGAVYVAAKRNASVLHVPFHELYATFAASHFFVAFDVCAMLSISHIWWMAGNLGQTTWPIWMLAVCFLTAPFLYNPQARPRVPNSVVSTLAWLLTVRAPMHRHSSWRRCAPTLSSGACGWWAAGGIAGGKRRERPRQLAALGRPQRRRLGSPSS